MNRLVTHALNLSFPYYAEDIWQHYTPSFFPVPCFLSLPFLNLSSDLCAYYFPHPLLPYSCISMYFQSFQFILTFHIRLENFEQHYFNTFCPTHLTFLFLLSIFYCPSFFPFSLLSLGSLHLFLLLSIPLFLPNIPQFFHPLLVLRFLPPPRRPRSASP